MEWAITHLEGVTSQCKHQVYINQPLPPEMTSDPNFVNNATESDTNSTESNNNATNTNGTTSSSDVFTPEFLEKVEKLSCTNDCFGNGICNEGKHIFSNARNNLK